MSMRVIRVAVHDHRRLVREGLCLLLNDERDIEARELVGGEADSADVILTTEKGGADMVSRSGARLVVFHDATTFGEILADVCADARPLSVEPSAGDGPRSSSPPSRVLTQREAEILHCIAAGLSANEVSEQLGISRKTVEGHKRRIFTKLHVQNQAHAVAIATRSGLLERQG